MYQIEYKETTKSESARLVSELSHFLRNLNGNQGHGNYDVELSGADKDAFVVLRLDKKPVACGAIHYIDPNTCEIKRMFSKRMAKQDNGMGAEVLHVLENKAKLLGYSKVVLATRTANENAVKFYLNSGYRAVTPYGKYSDRPEFICFGKQLYRT